LMVGMGMPRQEHWVLDHLDTLPNCPILTCGACFEYIAGVQRTPPRWMGRIGLEWLARLVMDPRCAREAAGPRQQTLRGPTQTLPLAPIRGRVVARKARSC
jgi:exopolysaccharide biosynthesis WecB/TagA/CpsF family protein